MILRNIRKGQMSLLCYETYGAAYRGSIVGHDCSTPDVEAVLNGKQLNYDGFFDEFSPSF